MKNRKENNMKDDSYVLIATFIKLDKEKIEKDGVYDYDALIERLDYIFESYNLEALVSGNLYGNKIGASYKETDENQSRAMYYLTKCKWFMENVETWMMSFSYKDKENRKWCNVIDSVKKYELDKVVRYVE